VDIDTEFDCSMAVSDGNPLSCETRASADHSCPLCEDNEDFAVHTVNAFTVKVSHRAALSSTHRDEWETAISNERNSLVDNEVYTTLRWSQLTHEERENIQDSFEMLTEKGDGTRKARIVVDGSTEEADQPLFASVAAYVTIRVLLALAFILGLSFYTIDVRTAFLQSAKDGELPGDDTRKRRKIVRPPRQHPDREKGLLWLVSSALYGLRGAPRRWRRTIGRCVVGLGFRQCMYDDCVYVQIISGSLCIVLLYVDDVFCLAMLGSGKDRS